MGCIIAIVGVFSPRLILFFIWLLTNWLDKSYDTAIWPLLGFLFMPYTTLVYMGAKLNGGFGLGWTILLIIAILFDLFSDENTATQNR